MKELDEAIAAVTRMRDEAVLMSDGDDAWTVQVKWLTVLIEAARRAGRYEEALRKIRRRVAVSDCTVDTCTCCEAASEVYTISGEYFGETEGECERQLAFLKELRRRLEDTIR